MRNTFLTCCALLTLLACNRAHTPAASASVYRITKQISLAGDGFWDYLNIDPATQRLFVSHGTQVQVVDLKTGQLTGSIADTKGVHGIAFAPELGKGFISCGRDTSVTVFNLANLAVTAKIKVTGANPDAILYDPFSRQVFTFNHSGNSATMIDAASNKVMSNIPLQGSPEFAVTDGQGKIFVNIEDKNSLAVIDAKSGKVLQTWPLSPGEEPSGLAFDVKNQRLFAVCSNHKMVVVDAKTGKVVQSLAIGDGPDGVAFDPGTHRIYSSNGEGSLTVIEEMTPDKYRVVTNIPTQKGARTIALDPITHCLYLPTADREAAVGNARPGIKAGSFVVLEVSTQ